MSYFYQEVGRNIRFYRKLRNLTQADLGGRINFDQSYVGKIERGEINVSLETVEKIADSLQIIPNQLFENKQKLKSEAERVHLEKINLMLTGKTSKELKHIQHIVKEILLLQECEKGSQ
ncbi:helix-turn-helix transcriptional regulator [Paenibacillus chondroitinus]|uniref:Helix-turn-helix transcriptional regulator n=1 Tax=Paenibacillus chondroitinus TaxID=59842 RepID=A0ABU6DGM4_9BACL|nr:MULTISPECIES: helix-turn-helix transcriptional regulator [Paenibacillus]MCY9659520.1 helix-turn-helix domain-containing protein [Paenibacillus anseongense]MEB4796915.1 helix-turn-helix transcriptional regulator [Paenibacillus chondroitinus]